MEGSSYSPNGVNQALTLLSGSVYWASWKSRGGCDVATVLLVLNAARRVVGSVDNAVELGRA